MLATVTGSSSHEIATSSPTQRQVTFLLQNIKSAISQQSRIMSLLIPVQGMTKFPADNDILNLELASIGYWLVVDAGFCQMATGYFRLSFQFGINMVDKLNYTYIECLSLEEQVYSFNTLDLAAVKSSATNMTTG